MDPIPNTPGNEPGSQPNPDKGAAVAASVAVAAKHEGKRGRGRPPGSGKSPGPRVAADTPPPETQRPPIDREFIEKTAEVGLRILDGIVCRKVSGAVNSFGTGDFIKQKAQDFTDAVAMSETEIKMVSGTIGVIAEKYSALFSYAPEMALGAWMLGYGVRVGSALSEIRKMAEEIAEIQRQRANTSQAD
jgi:hypothetical protein